MEAFPWSALLAAAVIGSGHLVAPKLAFVRLEPRSQVLSAAGGISVAYVFVHLLPAIASTQQAVEDAAPGPLASLERHAYLLALVGLAVFYGLERAASASRSRVHPSREEGTQPGIFWVSVSSFAVYNTIIGALLLDRADEPAVELALFTGALAVHMVVNDLGLRDHHRFRYDRYGRWILVAAPLIGLAVAALADPDELVLGLGLAFLGGGIVLNVLKEELPEERASRFGAFVAGAGAYAALLLVI